MTIPVFTAEQVRQYLVAACRRATSEVIFAQQNGIDRANVNAVTRGAKRAGGAVAEAAGFQRVTLETYIRNIDAEKFVPPEGFEIIDPSKRGGRPKEVVKPKARKRA